MHDSPLQQPLGHILVNKGVISDDQLRIALQEQTKSHQPLGRLLVSLGFLSEATIRDVMSENLGQKSVDLAAIIDPAALTFIPKELIYWEARAGQLVSLQAVGNQWARRVGITRRRKGSMSPAGKLLLQSIKAAALTHF